MTEIEKMAEYVCSIQDFVFPPQIRLTDTQITCMHGKDNAQFAVGRDPNVPFKDIYLALGDEFKKRLQEILASKEDELQKKTARLAELNAMLNLDKTENEFADGEKEEAVPEREPQEQDRGR